MSAAGAGFVRPVRRALPALPDAEAEVRADARASLQKHARSFRIAARLLDPADADDAAICYALCREADDLVDEAPSADAATAAITTLREELGGRRSPRPLVRAFYTMALRRQLPVKAMWTLVDTIALDATEVRIPDDAALIRYAYGVAGTVGLMMAGLLGAYDPRARSAAIDLGIGMQLTNVARDVTEDAARGRVYLPADRLRSRGVTPEAVVAGLAPAAAVVGVTGDLVALAERYYASALGGLRYLPFRGRVAVAVAAALYRAIGHAVVRRGEAALERRTSLGKFGLAVAFVRGLLLLAHPRVWGPAPARDTELHLPLAGVTETSGPCPTA